MRLDEIQEPSMATTNELVQQALAKYPHKELKSEIEYRLEIQAESEEPTEDYYLALQDTEDFAVDNRIAPLTRAARRVLIELGVYRSVSEDELARTQTFGGKKYYFKLAGIKYQFGKHLRPL